MNHSLSLVAPSPIGHFPLQAQLVQRIILYPGELYRVPMRDHLLHVLAGMAYITQVGRDRILRGGQKMGLDSTADVALISGIGCEAVIFELFETHS